MSNQPTAEERERSFRRVRKCYEVFPEWERLERSTDGALELAVNKAWIERHLPPNGARTLDIGGGPGRYAIWLAGLGYRVTLADLSPDLLDTARAKAKEAGANLEAIVEANAIDLSQFADKPFDAVLCMGPMYHLIDENDRQQAARELARVAAPGAPVFVAFLNRLPMLSQVVDPEFPLVIPQVFDLVDRVFGDGVFISSGRGVFTDSYYAHPAEIKALLEGAGFQTIDLISSESVLGGFQKNLASFETRQPERYPWVIERATEIANEPSIVGTGWHLLYIGQKP
ncbi:MAG: methyltransferase domain-containing protein [Dehalococcoidia bacterium]